MTYVSLHVGVVGPVRRPFCVLYKPCTAQQRQPVALTNNSIRSSDGRRLVMRAYVELGRTETMPTQIPPSPCFIRAFLLATSDSSNSSSANIASLPEMVAGQDYPHTGDSPTTQSRYRLALYDRRSSSDDLRDHILLGSVRFSLPDIVDARTRVDLPLLLPTADPPPAANPSPPAADATAYSNKLLRISDRRKGPAKRHAANEDEGNVFSPTAADFAFTGTESSDKKSINKNSNDNSIANSAEQPIRVTLRANVVSQDLYIQRRRVVFEIAVPLANQKTYPHASIAQVIDVSYADLDSGSNSRRNRSKTRRPWLPLYRSESLRESNSFTGHVAFEPVVLPEWRLGALDRDLRIRILLYDSRSRCLRAAAVSITSLARLQEMDPLTDVLPIMSVEATDESVLGAMQFTPHLRHQQPQQLGHFVLHSAEPASFGGVFKLRASYSNYSAASASNTDSSSRGSRSFGDGDSQAPCNFLPLPYLSYSSSECTEDLEHATDPCSDDEDSSAEISISGDSDAQPILHKRGWNTYPCDLPGVINVAGAMLPDRPDKSRDRALRSDLQEFRRRASSPSHVRVSTQDYLAPSHCSWSPITPLRPRSPSTVNNSPGTRPKDRCRSASPRNGVGTSLDSYHGQHLHDRFDDSRARPKTMHFVTGLRASSLQHADLEESPSQQSCLLVRKSSQPLTFGLGKRSVDTTPRQQSAPNCISLRTKKQELHECSPNDIKAEKRRGIFGRVKLYRTVKINS